MFYVHGLLSAVIVGIAEIKWTHQRRRGLDRASATDGCLPPTGAGPRSV